MIHRLLDDLPARPDAPPYPQDLGLVGGPMDGGYAQVSNTAIPAGYTYFLQFAFHDLTVSSLPAFDLGSVYGGGPGASPGLYEGAGSGRLIEGCLTAQGALRDLPRDGAGRALIADPRNDSTIMLGQIHSAFMSFHNHVLERCGGGDAPARFVQARSVVESVYRTLLVDDVLPRLVDHDAICRATEAWRGGPALLRLPRAFVFAAGRFGHAMVKPRYRLNREFDAPVFRPVRHSGVLQDLRGQGLDRHLALAWDNFFPTGSPMRVQASSRLNTRLARPLFHLPVADNVDARDASIAYRTLRAGQAAGLPEGIVAAVATGCDGLSETDIWAGAETFRGAPAPLWYYILREADIQCHGSKLGQLGSLLLADTIIGAAGNSPSRLVAPEAAAFDSVGAWIASVLDTAG